MLGARCADHVNAERLLRDESRMLPVRGGRSRRTREQSRETDLSGPKQFLPTRPRRRGSSECSIAMAEAVALGRRRSKETASGEYGRGRSEAFLGVRRRMRGG